ncbi:MAG: competence protein ComEC [Alphaproteobacteria bacterium]|jgi:competence protein ComEC|nr:competence protein ComEC [Alphaproteobacteria bacterium]
MTDQNRPRGRAAAWRPWSPARRPALAWPDGLAGLAQRFAQRIGGWALADVGPGRLVPWLAVAFGFGIVLYFTAEHEPAPWAAAVLLGAAVAGTVLARSRPLGFPLALAVAAIAAGFATATLKRSVIAHPVLPAAAWNVEIAGFVEVREERERSDRVVVRIHRIAGPRLGDKPERVRVSVRKGTAPAVGSFVEFKARLTPPLEPLYPGGYDFARDLYFQRIGASGFALGAIRIAAPPVQGGYWLAYAATIDGMREAIDKRIRAVVPGDKGAIASALITGKRDAISAPVNDAMYISGIGHVLSISGYHMAVVVGIVFFTLRALFALMPAFAGRYPIKKWAALAALGAAAFYLLLSGAEVATQRSFIMIGIVLVGVMADRPALTLRTLTVAALGVLLLAPESVVHPSFQMSFAATLAIVAGYQGGVAWMHSGADTPLGARIALWGGREIVGLLLISLVAGFATTLYTAYHFHRLAPYGAIANLLAMPVVSAWVMPMGILGVLALPFGFDGFFWRLMGDGLDWMIWVALWVTSLPGSVGRMAAFGTGPLLLGTAGLIVLGLLKSPLRLTGAILLAGASLWAVRTPQPDVLISSDGASFAVRNPAGRLALLKTGSDNFAIQQWLAADADARSSKDKALVQGIACDDAGCIARLKDGSLVAIARTIEAFAEDCRRAVLVMSQREAPPGCAATVIDRKAWQHGGALSLRRVGDAWETTAARPAGYDRPWARARAPVDDAPAATASTRARTPPRDATPRVEDLEPGD